MVFHPVIENIILTNSFKKSQELKQKLKLAYVSLFGGGCGFVFQKNNPNIFNVEEKKIEELNGWKKFIYNVKAEIDITRTNRKKSLLERISERNKGSKSEFTDKDLGIENRTEDSNTFGLFGLLNFMTSSFD